MTTDELLIKPVYWQDQPGDPIDLGSVDVEFTCESETYRGIARVTMELVPDDRICFSVSPTGSEEWPMPLGFQLMEEPEVELKLTSRQIAVKVLCVGCAGKDGAIIFTPTKSGFTVTPASETIVETKLHLFNFPGFFGSQDYSITKGSDSNRGWTRCGRVLLNVDGWVVTIAATDQTKQLCDALREQGGFVITHMVKIEREDGSTFSSDTLEEFLRCLYYFLSFALGRWAGVALPIGYDREGRRVFEQWGAPAMARGTWIRSCSWFDVHNAQLLSEVFPGFVARWHDGVWNDPLRKALYWYVPANDRNIGIGVDTAIVLAQTALELLAWTYCTRDRKMISPEAFKPGKLSAADRLRLLSSALDIPLDIPSQLSALHAQPGRKWTDAMDAITVIRNSLVHPDAKTRPTGKAYYEAWVLSLWYLDMILLRLCGHQGSYVDRLNANGQVEVVPWPKTTTDQSGRVARLP